MTVVEAQLKVSLLWMAWDPTLQGPYPSAAPRVLTGTPQGSPELSVKTSSTEKP